MNDTLILFALRYVNKEDLTDEQIEVFLSLLHQSGLLVGLLVQKRKGPGKRPDILIYCKFLHFIIVVELKFGAKENSTNAMRQMSKNKYSHKWYTDRRDCKPNEVIEIDKAIAIAIHAKIKCDEEQSEDEEEEDTDSNSENNSTDANEDELDQWDGDECIDWEAEIQIKSADRGKNEKIEDFLKRFELSLIN